MIRPWLFAIEILLSGISATASDTKPILSKSPLNPDQIAVYQSFLASYTSGSKSDHLNLAMRTSPLELSDAANACLNGIRIELAQGGSVIHEFDPQVSLPAKIALVDPVKQGKKVRENDPSNSMRQGKSVDEAVKTAFASGLLTLSEVAFDKTHQYAVMRFSFWCGGLCGQGETIVFQRKNGKWERTNRQCGAGGYHESKRKRPSRFLSTAFI